MRLLNVSDIKVGDWIEWSPDYGKTWYRSETTVSRVTRLSSAFDSVLCAWWENNVYAWPIEQCRKVKGPDETTERPTC